MADDYAVIGGDASYITKQGEALAAKILASKGTLTFTRARVGNGSLPGEMTPYLMTDCNGYICDAKIEGVTNPYEGQVCLGVQLTSIGLPAGIDITNLAIMAEDPDTGGEVCYCYVALHTKPQWVRPDKESVNTLARFLVFILVSGVQIVDAWINPDVLITFDQMETYFETIVRPACFEDAKYYVDFIHNLNYPGDPDMEEHPWLQRSIRSLWDMVNKLLELFNGQGSAPFYWDVGIIEGWEIEEGVINLTDGRVEC